MAEVYHRLVTRSRDNPVKSVLAASSLLALAWLLRDFRDWKAFGTGGTPPNARGYLRMTILRLKFIFHDVFDASALSTDGPSFLKSELPPRAGGPPRLMPRILPQRQHPEPIDSDVRDRLQELVAKLASAHPDVFVVRPSHTEGKTTAGLYALPTLATLNPIAKDPLLNHEIAHAHPADNSLHVWVSDADARKIIMAGWGCRFCLPFVKSGWTMVYAPRNDAELDIVEGIVRAACAFIAGVEI